jgi:hypothetical protein
MITVYIVNSFSISSLGNFATQFLTILNFGLTNSIEELKDDSSKSLVLKFKRFANFNFEFSGSQSLIISVSNPCS